MSSWLAPSERSQVTRRVRPLRIGRCSREQASTSPCSTESLARQLRAPIPSSEAGDDEDDEDYGALIVYTGAGGRDADTGQQVADQHFTAQNLALVKSEAEGLSVRVIRGSGGEPAFSPATGFRYDGLFRVEESWREAGQSGYQVCRYRMVQLADDGTPLPIPPTVPSGPAPRAETTVQRIVRNTEVSRRVKKHHNHTCQICGSRIAIASGGYSEGAHIRPLGRPHDGPIPKRTFSAYVRTTTCATSSAHSSSMATSGSWTRLRGRRWEHFERWPATRSTELT